MNTKNQPENKPMSANEVTSQSGNASVLLADILSRISSNSLQVLPRAYPSVSQMLSEMMQCSHCFDYVAGNEPSLRSYYQDKLILWKSLGRPELAWPQSVIDALPPVRVIR